jgi:hypothetical protein
MSRLRDIGSALRGPVSHRIRIRRSTVLLFLLFVGLGALWIGVRTEAATSTQGVIVEPKPGGGFTITSFPTTTTKTSTTTATTQPVSTTLRTSPAPPTTGPSPTTTVVPTTAPGLHGTGTSTTTATTLAPPRVGGTTASSG